jgi:hypothetical protein
MRLLAFLTLLPAAAHAHPGVHSGADLFHLLTEPDHLAMAGGVVGVVVAVLLWLRKRRQP